MKEYDFNGNFIPKVEDRIQISSIWMYDIKNEVSKEIIQFGNFDINDVYVTGNYLYFVKIIDADQDGILSEVDYGKGEMWRVHLPTLKVDYCFKIQPYNFHRFLTANDDYIVFISEDRLPYVTEIVFYSIKSQKFSVLNNYYERDWYDFRIVNHCDGEPDYFIFKREVDVHSKTETSIVNVIHWLDLISQLQWA
ncbi:hypothetical protein M5X00_03480 [Paenibacillus alvei]|nr:hypothetical protein [Paenibacillus alvei]MCY9753325.1 hypothetical protein [Paenibacillus alvei]